MSVRYIPKLGRFLQVDPIEGGVQNNYIYPPDAVNEFDLDGRATRNYSFCLSAVIAGCIGVIFDDRDVYLSLGGGIATPGPGGSITYGRGQASSGALLSATGGYGAGGSVNWNRKGRSYESGLMARGASLMAQHNTCLTCRSGKASNIKRSTTFTKNLKSGKTKKTYYNTRIKKGRGGW